ncbi:MAG: amidohydrolase family protein [Spirochaetia bacterium]|nr:amidohydrolase family protein [Spirochaetia bacterium]
MEIIDFHTHFLTPDRTKEAYDYLLKSGLALPGADGELKGLKIAMKKNGIGYAINLPAALSGEQAIEANTRVISHNHTDNEVYSLGTMHMELAGDAEKEARRLKQNGVKGVKLNPNSQGFWPDDDRMAPVYDACASEGLFVLFHAGAGAEPGFDPAKINAGPSRFKRVIKEYKKMKIVLAHMGGLMMWREAMDCVIGKDVFIDTAYTTVMDDALFCEVLKAHGVPKVLFGSDFPWQDPGEIAAKVDRCVKDEEDRERIFFKNAKVLLGG